MHYTVNILPKYYLGVNVQLYHLVIRQCSADHYQSVPQSEIIPHNGHLKHMYLQIAGQLTTQYHMCHVENTDDMAPILPAEWGRLMAETMQFSVREGPSSIRARGRHVVGGTFHHGGQILRFPLPNYAFFNSKFILSLDGKSSVDI